MRYETDFYFKNDQEIKSFKTKLLKLNYEQPGSYFLKSKAKHGSLMISLMNLPDDKPVKYRQMRSVSSIDNSKKEFQNLEQYELYLKLENWFDEQLKRYYFSKNNLFEFINWVDKLLSKIPVAVNFGVTESGYISQWSHFYAFLNSLTIKQRRKLIDQFELFYKKNNHDKVLNTLGNPSSIVLETTETVESMIAQKKLDFYSPSSREEQISLNSFASYYHKKTVLDDKLQRQVIKSYILTSSRWLINLVYEKMILMNFTVLEKYFMNFCLTKRHANLYPESKYFCDNVGEIR